MVIKKLISAMTTATSSPKKTCRQIASEDVARPYTVYLGGTWGGATATVEITPDQGTNWFPLLDRQGNAVTATANKSFICQSQGTGVRMTLSSVTTTSLNLWVA